MPVLCRIVSGIHKCYLGFLGPNTNYFDLIRHRPNRLGQIRSKFQNSKFSYKICLSCADLSQESINFIYLYERQLEMQKLH